MEKIALHQDEAPGGQTPLRLIGSPICPYVARARLVAKEKGLDLPTVFIDLSNKPTWFLMRSPTGTVPALEVGEAFIFEASVISEFLDEITPGSLHPIEPQIRALNRSWIEFASTVLRQQYFMMRAPSLSEARKQGDIVQSALRRVEATIKTETFFNGPSFSIIDAAYAPLFVRCHYMASRFEFDLLHGLPKLGAWSQAIRARPSVLELHNNDHYALLADHLFHQGSMFA